MDLDAFNRILDTILEETDLLMEKEHEHIYEFFDGEEPIFKLIYSPPLPDDEYIICVAFHVELDSPYAIRWFQKLQGFVPELELSACYIRDENGDTYIGQDAHAYRQQKAEREILNAIKREAVKRKSMPKSPAVRPTNVRATTDADSALDAFDEWSPKKNRNN